LVAHDVDEPELRTYLNDSGDFTGEEEASQPRPRIYGAEEGRRGGGEEGKEGEAKPGR
jgi:hypothetical protein